MLAMMNTVTHGDCRTLADRITSESVDLILCDPVYQETWQYEWLVHLGQRVLRPGGSLLAECGCIHRFASEHAMHHAAEGTDLIHRPLMNEIFTGGFTYVHMHRCHRAANHLIWFEKGEIRPGRGCPRTAFYGTKDKSFHEWGDGERVFAQLVEWFTQPGDLVLDPFAGGGTVPAVCKRMARTFIGFEIDHARTVTANARLRDVTVPLFVPEPAQHKLFPV